MRYRITAVTETDNFVHTITCNVGYIITHTPPALKYMIAWNVSDVQSECERKGWTLEALR